MVRIRPVAPGDEAALGLLHVRTWRAAYRGQIPQDYLDSLDPADRERQWRQWIREIRPPAAQLLLEHESEGPIGFVAVAPSPEATGAPADPPVGEVHALYVLPEHWGTGAGRLLMAAGMRSLRAAGCTTMTLWVLATNERARRFYEKAGWRPDGTTKIDHYFGIPLHEVRYRYDDATAGGPRAAPPGSG